MVDPHVTMGLNTNGQMAWMILGSPIFGNPYITWICVPGAPQKSKPDSLKRFPKSWMFHREISRIIAQELIAEW